MEAISASFLLERLLVTRIWDVSGIVGDLAQRTKVKVFVGFE
jgi:hypothetical protein